MKNKKFLLALLIPVLCGAAAMVRSVIYDRVTVRQSLTVSGTADFTGATVTGIGTNGGGGVSQAQITAALASGTNNFVTDSTHTNIAAGAGYQFTTRGSFKEQLWVSGGDTWREFHFDPGPQGGAGVSKSIFTGPVLADSFSAPSLSVINGSFSNMVGNAAGMTNLPSYSIHFYTNAITTNWIIGGIYFTNNGIQYVIPFGTNQ